MKKKLIVLSGVVLGSAPVLALAQVSTVGGTTGGACSGVGATGTQGVTDVATILCRIGNILNLVVPVLLALGIVYFVWGVINYVIASDEEAKKAGRDRIIYGIIGLAVIVGVWGLVKIVTNTFGIQNSNQTDIILPTINQ